MGEVYRARDPRLDREVAVKVLPEEVAGNTDRLLRFQQEAKAAGALNHANILAVHDVGAHEGSPYVVTELLKGETLRQRLGGAALPVREAVGLAIQVAHGLAAAHDRGIVHRDLKPDNLFVTQDGLVKILDFGLAKVSRSPAAVDQSAETASAEADTEPGTVMGTVGYMSPEQVRGERVDHRSDVFSLGTVLYEMLSGRRPFERPSTADTVAAILREDPPSLNSATRAVPVGLERVVQRCLEKRTGERFQSARDLAFALEAVSWPEKAWLRGARLLPLRAVGWLWRRPAFPRIRTFLYVLGGLALFLAGYVWAPWHGGGVPEEPRLVPRQLTRDPGRESEPAISPDGRLVAFTSDRSGNDDIWIVDDRGGDPLRLTRDEASDGSPAWFPDGDAVAFVSDRSGSASVWKMPWPGGAPILLIPDAEDPAVSPDGTRIAFSKRGESGSLRIVVAPVGDPARASVLTDDTGGVWDHMDPAWSPDGRTLCYSDFDDLWLVPSSGGPSRRLTTDPASDREATWSADGRQIYFTSRREGTLAIWRVPVEGGNPVRVTLGTGPEGQPSVSRKGNRLAYSTFVADADLVILDRDTGERVRLPSRGREVTPAFAPDRSRLVYASDHRGSFDLWSVRLEGTRPRGEASRLTELAGAEMIPVFSPDGRWIAFGHTDEGQRDVWVVSAGGGPPRRLTHHPALDLHPAWSPDGSQLAFVSGRSGREHVWRVPLEESEVGGEPMQVTFGPETDHFPAWSPDGSTIAFVRFDQSGSDVWAASPGGSSPPRRLTTGADARFLRWDKASGSLLVSGAWGTQQVSLRRLDPLSWSVTKLQHPAVSGGPEALGDFDLSRDGRLLAFVEQASRGDIWLLEAGAASGREEVEDDG